VRTCFARSVPTSKVIPGGNFFNESSTVFLAVSTVSKTDEPWRLIKDKETEFLGAEPSIDKREYATFFTAFSLTVATSRTKTFTPFWPFWIGTLPISSTVSRFASVLTGTMNEPLSKFPAGIAEFAEIMA
jgi:hypothetical protein